MSEVLQQCNLCEDVVTVVYPNDMQHAFMDTCDELYRWMVGIEQNIERGGGYMIDEWRFVDARQQPMDVRNRVRLTLEEK